MTGTGNVATDRSPSARISAPNIRLRAAEPVIAIDPMPPKAGLRASSTLKADHVA
jgi:hypothetical protein